MYTRLRTALWSIFAAIALTVCLGLTLFVSIILFRGEDAIKEEDGGDSAQVTDCQFASQAEQLMLYYAPINAPSQQQASLLGQAGYPILAQNRGYYLLQVDEETVGWADSRVGTVEGDCEEIPVDETPLAEFPTVCALTSPDELVLYSEAELVTPGETVAPGSFIVEAVQGTSYYLVLDSEVGGWVAAPAGQLNGNCDALTTPASWHRPKELGQTALMHPGVNPPMPS